MPQMRQPFGHKAPHNEVTNAGDRAGTPVEVLGLSPSNRKVLGQSAPNATTETVLYTVPAATKAEITMFSVSNRGTGPLTFRMGLSVGGGALGNADYVYYDISVPPNNSFVHGESIHLSATDEIRVYCSNANGTFNVTGTEHD